MRCVQQRSLEQVIMQFIGEEAYHQLKTMAGNRCLIILEGMDEMAADRHKSDHFFLDLIEHCVVLEKSTILITSRPHACDKLNADRQVEVIGFASDKIEEFIKKSFPNDEHSANKLLQQFSSYPHLKSLCYSPLNLIMITDIFRSSQDKKLPSTFTELYKVFIVMILQREFMKEDKKYSGASIAKNNGEVLKKLLPGIPINAVGTAFSLCKLSFCGFFDWHIDVKEKGWFGDEKKWKDPKFSFTTEDLIQCDIEVTNQFDGFGLLKATHVHEVPTDTSAYNFSHLSIQEFLCSLYISLLPQKEQLHIMNKHFQDYPNVFIFLSGLTMLQCNELYQIIYNKMMPVDTFSSNLDVVPAVRSIYESN